MRDLVSVNLINDPGVIVPLIKMLDYPGVHTAIPSMAAQALGELTKRMWGENYSQWDDPVSRHKFVAWWHDWWSKNKNKHPVCDSEIQEKVKTRIAAIELQLGKDMTNYSALRYLNPESINISYLEPYHDEFVDIRPAKENDSIYLRITAKFATPPPAPH